MSYEEYDAFREKKSAALEKMSKNGDDKAASSALKELGNDTLALVLIRKIANQYAMKTSPTGGNRQARALAEAVKRLNSIDARILREFGDLDTVSQNLAAHGVKSGGAQAEATLEALRNRVLIILENHERWARDPESDPIRLQMRQSFEDLRRQTRKLMASSQAHCLDVFGAFIFTFDLAVMLSLEADEVRQQAKWALEYVEDCFDLATGGSIARVRQTVRDEVSDLRRRDSQIRKNFAHFRGQMSRGTCSTLGVDDFTSYYCEVTGSLEDGYTVRNWSEETSQNCSRPVQRDGGIQIPKHTGLVSSCEDCGVDTKNRRAPVGTVSDCPENQIELDQLHARFRDLQAEEHYFTEFMRGLTQLKLSIEARLEWHEQYAAQ